MRKRLFPVRIRFKSFAILFGLILLLLVATGFAWINLQPGGAAQGADVLRGLFGDQFVGQLETTVYQIQDTVLQIQYKLEKPHQQAPWSASLGNGVKPDETSSVTGPSASSPTLTASPFPKNPITAATEQPGAANLAPEATATPESPWPLPALIPMGHLEGEGLWSPYILDSSGNTVAYRAFLQPDAERPYSIVAVVAFDLRQARLHFVLGSEEPLSDVSIPRPGTIDPADLLDGKLLAVFNGGFKARHGRFGVVAAGAVLIPPKDGLGTLVIDRDGRVKLGEWGTELADSPDIAVLRQNGPLVVHHHKVNPRVLDSRPEDWGYTVQETAPIWRSAVGLSADGQTLYYFAGNSLTLPVFASAMVSGGADAAIQLDINNYWVHFDTVQVSGKKLTTKPLFDEMGKDNDARYLYPYTRDFFYVTRAN